MIISHAALEIRSLISFAITKQCADTHVDVYKRGWVMGP